jgi:L-ascorbate metabolism protein UlaG (beta-lactamase superfamily)
LEGNPAVPDAQKHIDRLDLMLITHGHFDHMADAVSVAQQTKPDVLAIFEICHFLGRKGVEKCNGFNTGGTIRWNDVDVTLVEAIHSSGISDGDTMVYGGAAGGYVLRFPDGFTLYHTGDTDLFDNLRLIGRRYHPDVTLMCIGGHFTMGPDQAAEALRLLGATRVIPIHWGTFPLLTGTPQALEQAGSDISGLRVIALQPGQSVSQAEIMAH